MILLNKHKTQWFQNILQFALFETLYIVCLFQKIFAKNTFIHNLYDHFVVKISAYFIAISFGNWFNKLKSIYSRCLKSFIHVVDRPHSLSKILLLLINFIVNSCGFVYTKNPFVIWLFHWCNVIMANSLGIIYFRYLDLNERCDDQERYYDELY